MPCRDYSDDDRVNSLASDIDRLRRRNDELARVGCDLYHIAFDLLKQVTGELNQDNLDEALAARVKPATFRWVLEHRKADEANDRKIAAAFQKYNAEMAEHKAMMAAYSALEPAVRKMFNVQEPVAPKLPTILTGVDLEALALDAQPPIKVRSP